MTSNVSESLNAVLKAARGLSVIEFLATIRDLISSWIASRQTQGEKWLNFSGVFIVPKIVKEIDANVDRAAEYTAINRGNDICEVQMEGGRYRRVNLRQKHCDCARWQQLGYPCCHAAAALMKTKEDVDSYCDEVFSTMSYMRMYTLSIVPPSQ
ncbi:hypothetical protein GEMRC1_011024 [Eukaryota sp. GEM-RC1]